MPLQPFPDPDTFKIIGAAMRVHTELGCGFLEKVYKTALPIEFARSGIPFRREVYLPIYYGGQQLPLDYHVDFICFNDVIVEVKAADALTTRDEAQLLNYLKASKIRRGLLINFGADKPAAQTPSSRIEPAAPGEARRAHEGRPRTFRETSQYRCLSKIRGRPSCRAAFGRPAGCSSV